MVRQCEGCGAEDAVRYVMAETCRCVNGDGAPIGERIHDPAQHFAHCPRLQHLVAPYRVRLRRAKPTDGTNHPERHTVPLPAEFDYLLRNGFAGHLHSGYLWAQRMLCPRCIAVWEERQRLKRAYEARAKAKCASDQPNPYFAALCF